jgi:hypothetical protein
MATKWKLAQLESPYAGNVELNTAYARACMRDCLQRGEVPFASHLLYTQPGVLDDTIPEQRERGIEAGLAFREHAAKTVFYLDQGWSGGMRAGWDHLWTIHTNHEVAFRAFLNRDWIDPTLNAYTCHFNQLSMRLVVEYQDTCITFNYNTLERNLHAAETYLDRHGIK